VPIPEDRIPAAAPRGEASEEIEGSIRASVDCCGVTLKEAGSLHWDAGMTVALIGDNGAPAPSEKE
jgi:hypothetical protein